MEKKQKHFIQQPIYKGGSKAMTEFIYKNLRYPATALEAGTEGMVLVEYDIDHKGRVVATHVLKGIGNGCDEEACRVVEMLQFEVGKNRGVNVVFHQKAKIQFKKPAPVPAPMPELPPAPATEMVVQYNYTAVAPAPPSVTKKDEPATTQVFSYTVKLG